MDKQIPVQRILEKKPSRPLSYSPDLLQKPTFGLCPLQGLCSRSIVLQKNDIFKNHNNFAPFRIFFQEH